MPIHNELSIINAKLPQRGTIWDREDEIKAFNKKHRDAIKNGV